MWSNPYSQLLRKVNGLGATNVLMPTGIFNFTGQAKVDTFAIDLASLLDERRAYDEAMVNKYRLSLEAIRNMRMSSPSGNTGRAPADRRCSNVTR